MWREDGLHIERPELPDFKHQRRSKPGKTKSLFPHQMVGADTETLLGCADLFSFEVPNREGSELTFEARVEQVDSILDVVKCCISAGHYWRTQGRKGWACPNFFFWNLKFDAQAIFKLLSIRAIEQLIEEGETKVNAETGDFLPEAGSMVTLRYIEGKALTFSFRGWKVDGAPIKRIQWWDISQFFGKMRLQVAGEKYLNEGKQEICFDGSKLDASRFDEEEYYSHYQADIRSYAELDASLTGRLTRLKAKEFIENDVRFIEPYSVANIAQRNLLDMGYFPTMNLHMSHPMGREITRCFMAAFHGGLFEVAETGCIPDVETYDLASAYPFVMYHLPAISAFNLENFKEETRGQWYWGCGEEWNEAIQGQPFGTLGVVEISITFEKGLKWYPLTMKASSGTLITPRHYSGWITLAEYEEALKWPYERVSVGRWVIHCDSEPTYPFREWIEKHYETKVTAEEGSVERAIAKLQLNSGFGKTCQCIDGRPGKMWSPLYAATITGATRARMMEFNRLNGMASISLATDGIILERCHLETVPERPAPAPFNLGEWEYEGGGNAYILMSGVYSVDYIRGPCEGKVKSTFRGAATYPFTQHLRSFGKYASWITFFEENSAEEVFRCSSTRPNSLKESHSLKRDLERINVFEERSYSLRPAGVSTKRIYTVRPSTFGDLLDNRYTLRPHMTEHSAFDIRRILEGLI